MAVSRSPVRGQPDTWRSRALVMGAWVVALVVSFSALRAASSAFTATETARAEFSSSAYYACAGAMRSFAPFAWYPMDETVSSTTTMTDSSSNALDGVYGASGKTAGAAGACSSRGTYTAMTFDGTSGFARSARTSGAPNTFTLIAWFKTTSAQGGKIIGYGDAAQGASTTYDRHIYVTNAGTLIFGVFFSSVPRVIESPLSYNDGNWHLVVATLSTAGMRLYVDGALVRSDSTVTAGRTTTGGYWRIAYDNINTYPSVPTSRYFRGTLDDVAVVLTALTPDDVKALYESV